MKLLDTILHLVPSNGQAVLLRASQVALMLTGTSQSPLSLPPLTDDQMAEIVAEIVPLSVRARLRDSGSVDYTVPATGDRPELSITAIGNGDDIWLEIRPQRPAAAPSDTARAPDEGPPRPVDAEAAPPRRMRIATFHDVNALIARLADRSDASLFLHSGLVPATKIDGTVQWLDQFDPLAADDLGRILVDLSTELARHGGVERDDVLSWTLPDAAIVECRASLASPSVQITFRIKSTKPPAADRLGIPRAATALCREAYGVFAIAGPNADAVARTCHALIDHVNRECPHHVIVLERQAVTRHPRGSAFLSHRVVCGDDEAWTGALTAALAEGPDVLVTQHVPSWDVLEQLIAHAADMLIVLQLDAPSAVATLKALLELAPAARQREALAAVADALAGLMAQQEVKPRGAAGVSAYELLLATPGVRDLIRQGAFDELALVLERGGDGIIAMAAAIAELGRTGRIGPGRARGVPRPPDSGRAAQDEARGSLPDIAAPSAPAPAPRAT